MPGAVRGEGVQDLAVPEGVRAAKAGAGEAGTGVPAGKRSETCHNLVHFFRPWGGLTPAPFVKFNPSKSFCA